MTTLDAGRTTRAMLERCRRQVDQALRDGVDTLPPSTRHVCGYHAGWWDETGQPTDADGDKAIRPAMALLSAGAVGGDPADAVPAAVAVELVHDFSLLHDELLNHDRIRLHRPTAWAVFGAGPAVLAGEALLTLASDVLAGHPTALRGLAAAIQELTVAAGRTGALLGAACSLGALLGGGSPQQVQGMEQFGRDVGAAFQLVDEAGGQSWSERRADALTASALRHLAEHTVVAEAAAELQSLALLLTRQNR